MTESFEERKRRINAFIAAGPHGGANDRVYFVQESGAGFIKIGHSNDVKKRVDLLQIGTPHVLTVIATIQGARGVERYVHSLFEHARFRGEWFRPVPELIEYAREVAPLGREADKQNMDDLFAEVRTMRILNT